MKFENYNLDRGDGETLGSYRQRLQKFIERIEWQSGGHITWYTHKNPAGCWICDIIQVARRLDDVAKDLVQRDPESSKGDAETTLDDTDEV